MELTPEARANVTTPDSMEADIVVTTCTECHTGEFAEGFNFQASIDAARQICQSVQPPPQSNESE